MKLFSRESLMTLEELLERWGLIIPSYDSVSPDDHLKIANKVVKRLVDESMFHSLALYLTEIYLIADNTPVTDESLLAEIKARSLYSASVCQAVDGYVRIPINQYRCRMRPITPDDVSGPEILESVFYGFLPMNGRLGFSPFNLGLYDDELDDRAAIKIKYTRKNGESITVCAKGPVIHPRDIFVEKLNVLEIENEYMGKNHDLDSYRTNQNRLSEAELEALSICLDPKSDLYAAELDVAIKAYKAIFIDKIYGDYQSNTQKIISFVEHECPGTSDACKERIASVVNPKKTLPPAPLEKS